MSKDQTADRFHLGGGPVITTTAVDPRTAGAVEPVGTVLINPTTGKSFARVGAAGSPNTTWKGGGVSLLDASPTGTIDLYVDGATGNDANDGLTALTAKATIGGLRSAYWYQTANHQKVIVHLGGGGGRGVQTYTEDCLWIGGGEEGHVPGWCYVGPEMEMIVPTTGPATAVLDSGAGLQPAERVNQANAPSGTGNRTKLEFTTAAPGWTVNDLVGSFVRVTRVGGKVFFELPITENTADTLTVDTLGIVGALLATDTVEIVRPVVSIVAPPGGDSFGMLTLSGKGNGSGFEFGRAVFTRVEFVDLTTTAVAALSFDRCLFKGGLLGIFVAADGFAFVNCALWTELGLAGWGSAIDSFDDVPPLNLGASVSVSGGKPATLAAATSPEIMLGVYNQRSARCTWFVGKPMCVYDSNPGVANWGAVNVDVGSQLILNDVALGGNRNVEVGIRSRRASRVRVGAGVLTTITGAKGDLQVETGAPIAYGVGAGQFEEAVGWNGNFTRMLEGAAAAPTGDVSMITTRAI